VPEPEVVKDNGRDGPAVTATVAEPAARATVEDLLRACAPRVLAVLVRRYGGFDTCEDAVQEALLDASTQWPEQGVPANPEGWLVRTAARRWIELWRNESARRRREEVVAAEPPPGPVPAADDTLWTSAGISSPAGSSTAICSVRSSRSPPSSTNDGRRLMNG
jgi:DNA-directed RNA polymerase specialized sigma24 family protein